MDRYDRIIRDVRQKTDDEDIHWKVVSVGGYSDILLNSNRVVRAFAAEYSIGTKNYGLLFVERKYDLYDDMADATSEGIDFLLFVLDDDGQIVLNLYDGVVDRDDLIRLSGLIDARNDRARAFFEAFDQSGAA